MIEKVRSDKIRNSGILSPRIFNECRVKNHDFLINLTSKRKSVRVKRKIIEKDILG